MAKDLELQSSWWHSNLMRLPYVIVVARKSST